jgi:sulfite exporter TauE/SafE/copper chaperone CopZ
MGEEQRKTEIRIGGMTCLNCQNKIERKLRKTRGVSTARVSYNDGSARITYNSDVISEKEIGGIIESLGYKVIRRVHDSQGPAPSDRNRMIGILIITVALFAILKAFGVTNIAKNFPIAEAGMSYGMIFAIGLLTSVHCIAMCGGINISQCIPPAAAGKRSGFATFRPGLLYNAGRVASYTIIGGAVGFIGSVISFSGAFRGIVQLIAGVFMVIMGLNMLGILPKLGKIVPRMPRIFARKIDDEKERPGRSPLIIGLLNGLMPCGPLQAMQLCALSSGSMFRGALSMFLFSIGTLPLMFGLGALSSVLSKRFTGRVMTAGAALVIFLGLFMFTNGMNLSGFSLPNVAPPAAQSTTLENGEELAIEDGKQVVSSYLEPGYYPSITVKNGTPVKWVIYAEPGSINGCNRTVIIPEYDIRHEFTEGENVIEFEPTQAGTVPYSCWMGMIRSAITIEDNI